MMRHATARLAAAVGLVYVIGVTPTAEAAAAKTVGVFYPPDLIARARAAVERDAGAARLRDAVIEAAAPWMRQSDDELWSAMFGHTIKRSWMVWSNGFCPACRKSVPMYRWQMDAINRPWKTRCPHCQEIFPKNDFLAFYRSGLDEHGVFDPARADRKLLFNAEHPDLTDPLHRFGVDDGDGYVEGDHRWRFIGAYLIYGQWKQFVLGGIDRLADAWVLTGDAAYAHKAAVMLDRIADLYPTFDFFAEGVNYERHNLSNGYVSTWHDACVETRALVLAYDRIFDAIRHDESLVTFLSGKAKAYGLENPKTSFADIQRNIEDRILRDPLANNKKILSNYPQTNLTVIAIHAVLGWPDNRAEVDRLIDEMIAEATAVDGVSGEKGLAGYGSIAPRGLADFLQMIARADPAWFEAIFRRHPRLRDLYRFHIDTWCMMSYYPTCGDAGSFGTQARQYAGATFHRMDPDHPNAATALAPSMFSFMHRLYRLTDEPAFIQVLYHANGNSVDGLPHDLLAADPRVIQNEVQAVIDRHGREPKPGDVNKQEWHLAIFRSGEAADARAVWLDYDTGGRHSHADGMNLGLYARGLDLMPDLGYPPVQFGGWDSPRARWYTMTAAHNTVVVDGQNQSNAQGRATLWAGGDAFRAIRAGAPAMIGGSQYERTVAMVDVSPADFYVLDVFRVVGGTHHAKFMHSHFGTVETAGLSLEPAPDFGHNTQMRGFRADPAPRPGWHVDWTVDDRYQYLPEGSNVHLRYTDLTPGARAGLCEGWIVPGLFNSSEDDWIPRVLVERKTEAAPLASTFVAVIEPYENRPPIDTVERLPLESPEGTPFPEPNVAVELRLTDGRRDVIVAADVENPLALQPAAGGEAVLVQVTSSVHLAGEMAFVRYAKDGRVERLALARGRSLRAGPTELLLSEPVDFMEIRFDADRPKIVAGDASKVRALRIEGRNVLPAGA